jgi:ABC-type multidrug transport system fused ATPase/permease subunit
MHGRTTLVIAHRLSTIENADNIVVIVDGRIAEIGNHRQLTELGKIYCSLSVTQN